MAKSSAEIAVEIRGKFELYLLGLTFGILGLSIQTAEFGVQVSADIFELSGWLILFAAGIVGIIRGEWVPVAYDVQSQIQRHERERSEVQQALNQGHQVQIPFLENGIERLIGGAEAVQKLDGMLTSLEEQYGTITAKIRRRYNLMRWAFLVGIGCLMVARGIPPATSIGERLLPLIKG